MSSTSPARDSDLRERRIAASVHSQGISNDAIYAAIEARLVELGAGGDLLDFGAGTGQLTARVAALATFRSVTGADLYPRDPGLPSAISWIQGDLNDRLPVPDARFDAIVAAEVIEHLENPRAVARELCRLLRPGGVLVLSTPNNESWRALLALVARGHFVAFGDTSYPAHITALLSKDLDRLLREASFTDIAFSFTGQGGIPGFPARTWQSLLGRRVGGRRFSDNVIVTARKPGS